MKKTLQISIAQTLFTIEEDAYLKLDNYLTEVKTSFANTEGREEIIADIENRIAEQLVESKEKIITISTVEKVLKIMGSAEDFGDVKIKTEDNLNQKKKLYRDGDDMLIAGVCSGLGAYFNIDPVLVRLGFIVLTFLNGLGIFIYVVFWILVPEAKTKSQRLEMMGAPVTIGTLSEKFSNGVKEKMEEIKNNKNSWLRVLRDIINFPFKILGKLIRTFVNTIGPVARVLVSLVLIFCSLFFVVGVTIGSGFLISSGILVINNVPLEALLPGNIQILVFTGIALALVIPAFFVLIGGFSLLRKKNFISSSLGFGLLGLWFVSLMVSGFGIAKVITNQMKLNNAPLIYQFTNKEIPIKIQIENQI